MSAAFDVNKYWRERGRDYVREKLPREYHHLQEEFLLDVLRDTNLGCASILELGCGFGRITRLLANEFPRARIIATDFSEDQLANARNYCAGATNVEFATYDFYSDAPFPGSVHHDLAIAVEVFLHHPKELVTSLLNRLKTSSRWIVNVDWSEDWPWPRPEHVWVHDYAALYRSLGLDCVALPLPERIDGLQQQLFVAGDRLPPALRNRTVTPPSPATELPPALRWHANVELAIADLQRTIPVDADLVLVNGNEWGAAERWLVVRRIRPFLERQGLYWGPPGDDATADSELTRMRLEGSTHLAFAWTCFWWFDHYKDFTRHLRENYRCLLANDRVVIFQLSR